MRLIVVGATVPIWGVVPLVWMTSLHGVCAGSDSLTPYDSPVSTLASALAR